MAIVFKPEFNDSVVGLDLVIGGFTADDPSVGDGLQGPFPKYSISREDIYTDGAGYLNTKYTINISGTAIIRSTSPQDITIKGQRQDSIQREATAILKFARGYQLGELYIEAYGGGAGKIKFRNAKLLSVEMPEQSDEGAGIQNIEYSFVFEAYYEDSDSSAGGIIENKGFTQFFVSDVQETWDLEVGDLVTFENNDPTLAVNKTYIITRNLSATGVYNPILKEVAIEGAKKWIEMRILETTPDPKIPPLNINSYLTSPIAATSSKLFPVTSNIPTNNNFVDLNANSYLDPTCINHIRSVSFDVSKGSYSVTDKWTLCKSPSNSTFDISIEVDNKTDSPAAIVSVSMNIQGMDTNAYTSNTSNKYDNALTSLNLLKAITYNIANAAYIDAQIGGTLKNIKLTETIGSNRGTGLITYSCSYDDLVVSIEGAASESIQIQDDNEDGLNQIIAKIDIIGKVDGPIIQDMSTTTIKTRSVTIDALMSKPYRTNKPSAQALALANTYKPSTQAFRQSKTESWNPKTGTYNLSINWEYT